MGERGKEGGKRKFQRPESNLAASGAETTRGARARRCTVCVKTMPRSQAQRGRGGAERVVDARRKMHLHVTDGRRGAGE
jgi:hypothetical protein